MTRYWLPLTNAMPVGAIEPAGPVMVTSSVVKVPPPGAKSIASLNVTVAESSVVVRRLTSDEGVLAVIRGPAVSRVITKLGESPLSAVPSKLRAVIVFSAFGQLAGGERVLVRGVSDLDGVAQQRAAAIDADRVAGLGGGDVDHARADVGQIVVGEQAAVAGRLQVDQQWGVGKHSSVFEEFNQQSARPGAVAACWQAIGSSGMLHANDYACRCACDVSYGNDEFSLMLKVAGSRKRSAQKKLFEQLSAKVRGSRRAGGVLNRVTLGSVGPMRGRSECGNTECRGRDHRHRRRPLKMPLPT